ncbi:MAG TPA: AmmeMemoRadiSam system protein B [Phycisphaerae bacterium]|nr:AmmeMemoRadiSam system protein B [Phycisphaerae bacterium]HNU45873.1 AmmeMemoRadiSam system protein B [Phycisphaerae bacterium]
MRIREPVVAGQFYAGEPDACRAAVAELLEECGVPQQLPRHLLGGLVPHAGWVCSGSVAAGVFKALAASRRPKVIVLFGAAHRHRGRQAALFGSGRWETPLGGIEIDDRLAERILGHTNLIVDDPYAHENEHSLEVQLPLIKHLFPETKIVPIVVPSVQVAHEVGDAVARTVNAYQYDVVIVGTTDLTHYGPNYGFVPHGIGRDGNRWAKQENDRRFLEVVSELRAEDVVAEARTSHNACGGGAVAATLAAVRALGATRGVLLSHTTSSEVLGAKTGAVQQDSVGYAGVVFA